MFCTDAAQSAADMYRTHEFNSLSSKRNRKRDWLLQVAEMHGELMEFNEFLQKQLLCRELQLKSLTQELVSLRGPVSVLLDEQWIAIFKYALFCVFFLYFIWMLTVSLNSVHPLFAGRDQQHQLGKYLPQCSTFIKWTEWSLSMTLWSWWQHYKYHPGYYYYYYYHRQRGSAALCKVNL